MMKIVHDGYWTAEADYRIPAPYCREIGRIIVRWAYLEDLIQYIVWDLLHLDEAYGRLAVRDPRITDRLNMVRDLAALRKSAIDSKEFKFIYDQAERLATLRDHVAHGIWMKAPDGEWKIERTRGFHPKDVSPEKLSRRIEPDALHADLNGLRSIVAGIDALISKIQPIYTRVHEARPRPA